MNAGTRSEARTIVLCCIVTLVTFVLDVCTPLGVAAGVPYVVVVLLSLWSTHPRAAYTAAIAGSSFTGLGYVLSPSSGEHWKVAANRLLALFAIWVVAILCSRLKRVTAQQLLDERHARKAAEAGNRAKSEFLANMSHEIRTPMTAIMGFTDLLMSDEMSASERQEHLQTIHRNAEHLLAIISDILDLSKIEAEKFELEPSDCSPQEIVEEVVSLLQAHATEKNVGLETAYSYPLPKAIRTDPVRLRQILVNLVGNAVKFTQRGGVTIGVRLVQPEDTPAKMQFEIADTGIGMSEEEISRLFRPFTQADMSLSRRFGGTGLGLHVSQKLAKILDGQIEVESEPDVGSVFTLTIDPGWLEDVAMETAAPTLAKEEKPAKAGQKQKLCGRILLAEDVKEIRTLVGMNLEMLGLEVDFAENGRIALEKASSSKAEGRPYDLILMDIQMPEWDGFDATRRLRQDGWQGAIIALTAHAMTGDREKCLEAGCDDYISKPMADAELFDTIVRHLDKATPAQLVPAKGSTAAPPGLVGSTRIHENEKAELLAEFIESLSGRIAEIEEALRAEDLETLARLAHSLKGTAGLYGFPQISEAALVVEKQADEQTEPRAAAAELVDLCKRASGTKSYGN